MIKPGIRHASLFIVACQIKRLTSLFEIIGRISLMVSKSSSQTLRIGSSVSKNYLCSQYSTSIHSYILAINISSCLTTQVNDYSSNILSSPYPCCWHTFEQCGELIIAVFHWIHLARHEPWIDGIDSNVPFCHLRS